VNQTLLAVVALACVVGAQSDAADAPQATTPKRFPSSDNRPADVGLRLEAVMCAASLAALPLLLLIRPCCKTPTSDTRILYMFVVSIARVCFREKT
jgi:hypothetical protein